MSLTEAEKRKAVARRPATASDLPEHMKTWLAQQNPSPMYTMNKEQAANYLSTFGFPTNKAAIVRAVYAGKLASKRAGKRRLISQYDALLFALSGGEHFSRETASA